MTLSHNEIWILIIACAALTAVIKGFGPVLLGGRELPDWSNRVVALLAPALLSALVVTAVFADGRTWSLGAHTVGVAVAGVMLWRRLPLVLCVAAAVGVTALLRMWW